MSRAQHLSIRSFCVEDRLFFKHWSEDTDLVQKTGRTISWEAAFQFYCDRDSFIVENEGEPIGYFSLFDSELTSSFDAVAGKEVSFFLEPTSRGQGRFHLLATFITECARQLTLDYVIASCLLSNSIAIEALRSENYVPIFQRMGMDNHPYDELFLLKTIL